jgi:bacteriocin-like protein
MKKLSRNEMKNVIGGKLAEGSGSCASVNAAGEVMYNQTQAQASGVGAGGHWCCASCGTASWYGCGEPGCGGN